ncbi:alpha/beta fold hydrolase [Kroppenstedtia eburnea]|uniref:Pimeloyl-ACP methyl ester carboxylesterase n=1 Tax=Kroppenstedtia eburnea TaxID=714067 RepID=A0A1N7J087_9BACL|nr:alpha/beta hydrolase [Kroppenstedtia eburnea]QKI82377.1 alpha/beta fold hydrolase [Kroppenstedtia eburnea]SIS42704.1 Pimeloyl-ACP methyl ester carboxylesterase [Kroppenstedtia eburnea]
MTSFQEMLVPVRLTKWMLPPADHNGSVKTPGEAAPLQGNHLSITTDDGAVLAAVLEGDGPLVVLSHCWTGSHAIWAPVAERLVGSGYRVLSYDQRGHGASTVGAEGLSIRRIGADLASVLQALDAKEAIVAGHSLGGMAIQAMALHHPDCISKHVREVFLVATAAYGIGMNRLRKLVTPVIGSALLERVMGGRLGHLLVRGALGSNARQTDLVNTRDHFIACKPHVRSTILAAMQMMDLRDLKSIDVPVTVVHGTRDLLTPPSRGRELAGRLGAELVWIEGAGHMLPLEAPGEIAELIGRSAR